jgi:DNA-binding SARP family transcriptional activator
MMGRLSLTLLGGFAVRSEVHGPLTLPVRRAQALLAYLALPPGQVHPREKLTALLWDALPREVARARLRHTLFVIRRSLGAEFRGLSQEADSVSLDPAMVEVDAVAFERLAASREPGAAETAAALYRGHLLEGLAERETPFEDWLSIQRERLHELALETLARLLRQQTDAVDREAAVRTALRLLELDPLQEPVHRALMRLYRELGRRGAALRQYQECVAMLQRELGVEPEEETKALYRDVVRGATSTQHATNTRLAGAAGATPLASNTIVADASVAEAPLVGRAAELGLICGALETAWQGAGRVLIVSGEVGIGKSRLVDELAAEAARRGGLAMLGRGYATERILPFTPWIEALRRAGADELASLPAALGKSRIAELARLLPELGDPPPSSRVDGESWRRFFEAVTEVVHYLSGRRPVLVGLEDVHWADDMSVRLLAFIARRIRRWPVLVVATVREEALADAEVLRDMLGELAADPHVVHVRLGPLSPDHVRSLTAFLAPHAEDGDRQHLAEKAWRTSQGNPLVVVETIRTILTRPADTPGTPFPLPERIRDLVRERFGRLGATARELLTLAAVVGRDFDFALLHGASGLDEELVAAGVEELVRRRVLHQVGERFDFTHERIREVAASDIFAPRRRLLHRRIGEAIELLDAGNVEPHLASLALHFREGEVWAKAIAYLQRAGSSAWQRSAYHEGRVLLEQALSLVEYLPLTPERSTVAIDIRLALDRCLYPLGAFASCEEHLLTAQELVAGLDDTARRARVAIALSEIYRTGGDYARAMTTAEEGLALATRLGDSSLEVEARFHLGVALAWMRNGWRESIACLEAAGHSASHWTPRQKAGYPYAPLLRNLARGMAVVGRFAAACGYGEEAMGLAERSDDVMNLAQAYICLGSVHADQGNFSEAIILLERCLCLVQDHHVALVQPVIPALLGSALALTGRRGEARLLLETVLGSETPAIFQATLLPLALAKARTAAGFLALGDVENARRVAEMAYALAHARGEDLSRAEALTQLATAKTRAELPRWDEAEKGYTDALTIAEAAGARPLVAHCHCGLGELYRRMEKRHEAQAHLTNATAMYRAMDMTYWLEKVEKERKV